MPRHQQDRCLPSSSSFLPRSFVVLFERSFDSDDRYLGFLTPCLVPREFLGNVDSLASDLVVPDCLCGVCFGCLMLVVVWSLVRWPLVCVCVLYSIKRVLLS